MQSVLDSIKVGCPGCVAVAIAESATGALISTVADSPSDHAMLDRAAAVIPDLFAWLDALDAPAPFSDKAEPPGLARLVIAAGPRQLVAFRGSEHTLIGLVPPRAAPLLARAANALFAPKATAA
jgi:hypothetical protein